MSDVEQAIATPLSERSQEPTDSPRPTTQHVAGSFFWQKSATDRHQHVIARAAQRGGLSLDLPLVQSIEEEITYVRSLAKASRPKPKALATLVAHEYPSRNDFYAVLVGSNRHVFVWCRESAGLVSYVSRPDLLSRIGKSRKLRRKSSSYRAPIDSLATATP